MDGRLTAREIDVLDLAALGKTNAQIAEILGISEHTVERHLSNIYRKTGTHARGAAVLWATRRGFLGLGIAALVGLAARAPVRPVRPVDRPVDRPVIRPGRERYHDVLHRVADAAPRLRGPNQADALREIDELYPQFDAAFKWFLRTEQYPQAMALITDATWFLHIWGYLAQGIDWFDQLRSVPAAEVLPLTRARALNGAGLLLWSAGKYPLARERLDESLRLQLDVERAEGLIHRPTMVATYGSLGGSERARQNFGMAEEFYGQRLALCEMVGDGAGESAGLQSLGLIALVRGEYGAARDLFEQGLATLTRPILIAGGAAGRGDGPAGTARPEDRAVAYLRNNLGHTCVLQGLWVEALGHYRESLARLVAIRDRAGLIEAMLGHAAVAAAGGRAADAAMLTGVADAIRRDHGIEEVSEVRPVRDCAERGIAAAVAVGHVTAAAVDDAREHGRLKGLAGGLPLARSLTDDPALSRGV